MTRFSWDTETRLIEAGRLDPDLVCVTYCADDFNAVLLTHDESFEWLRDLFRFHTGVGANIAYDTGVIARKFPELLKYIFQAYKEGRILDLQHNQRLIDIANGELNGYYNYDEEHVRHSYGLSALHERYGFGPLSKGEDTWRKRYGELIDVPKAQWPQDAIDYPLDDARAGMRVDRAQQQYAHLLEDGAAQARAAFALHLMSVRGMVTDGPMCDQYVEETKAEIERCRKVLEVEKIVRPNGTKDTKAAKARMLKVCETYDLPVKKTPKGEPCLDAEACRDSGDAVLQAYSTFTSAKTVLTKAELLKQGSQGIPLQTSFEVLVNNGRSSSRAPSAPLVGNNFQNLPRGGKLRECFIPRPGFVYCSVDFASAELRTVAQVQLWALGKSKLAAALNEGVDVHCQLAATILGCSYEEVVANKKVGKYAKARQLAKAGNFGGWGFLQPKKLMLTVNRDAATPEDRIDLNTADKILKAWSKTWDADDYFNWCRQMCGENGRGWATIRQFVSNRIRGRVDFTALCNTWFSGLAADAFKAALFDLTVECYLDETSVLYGARPVLAVHDEIIAEIPEGNMHAGAYRMRDIMVEAFKRYTPDVVCEAEPALMRRWYKAASEAFDANGKLIPWEPKK